MSSFIIRTCGLKLLVSTAVDLVTIWFLLPIWLQALLPRHGMLQTCQVDYSELMDCTPFAKTKQKQVLNWQENIHWSGHWKCWTTLHIPWSEDSRDLTTWPNPLLFLLSAMTKSNIVIRITFLSWQGAVCSNYRRRNSLFSTGSHHFQRYEVNRIELKVYHKTYRRHNYCIWYPNLRFQGQLVYIFSTHNIIFWLLSPY